MIVESGTAPERFHLPRRPSWDCVPCKEPWPCAPAKVDMAEEYANDQLSLAMYLNLQMLDAIDDFAATRAPIPRDLFDRFLGWFRARRPRAKSAKAVAGALAGSRPGLGPARSGV